MSLRVVHKFFSPLDDPSKTTRESIEGVDLPALAKVVVIVIA